MRFYDECTKTLKTLFEAVFMRVSCMFALSSRSAGNGLKVRCITLMLAGRNGARGRIRTDTADVLDVVPLLVGLHERNEHPRPVSSTGSCLRHRGSWQASRVTGPVLWEVA